MKIFLCLISIFWLLAGIAFLLFPKQSKKLYANLIKPVKGLGILPLLIGILFLWASSVSRIEVFIRVLGIIALIKGLLILLCPTSMLKSIFNYFLGRSERCWRIYGAIMVLLGAVTGWSVL